MKDELLVTFSGENIQYRDVGDIRHCSFCQLTGGRNFNHFSVLAPARAQYAGDYPD